MSAKVEFDVPVLLPEVVDRGDRCLVLLTSELRSTSGVLRVHLPGDFDSLRLCIHHDPLLIDSAEIERIAREKGALVTEATGHLLWAVGWIRGERAARETGEALRGRAGVLCAEVTPDGVVRVEYDRRRIDAGSIERALHVLGLAHEESAPSETRIFEGPEDPRRGRSRVGGGRGRPRSGRPARGPGILGDQAPKKV